MKQKDKCMSCFSFEKKQGWKARKDQKCAKNNDTESHFRYYMCYLKKESCSGILKGKWWWMWQLSSDGSGGEWQGCRRELRSQTSFSCSLCKQAQCYTEQKFHILRASYLLSLPALPWGSRHEKLKHRPSGKNCTVCPILSFKNTAFGGVWQTGKSVMHSTAEGICSHHLISPVAYLQFIYTLFQKNHHQTIISLTEIELKTQALIKSFTHQTKPKVHDVMKNIKLLALTDCTRNFCFGVFIIKSNCHNSGKNCEKNGQEKFHLAVLVGAQERTSCGLLPLFQTFGFLKVKAQD